MNASDARQLVELLASRSGAWNSLWTLFYTVGAAVVGVVASGKLLARRRTAASLLAAAGFLVFAAGNYAALEDVRKQRQALVEFATLKANEERSPQIAAVAAASTPPKRSSLRLYHWSLRAFVVALLVVIPRTLPSPKDG